MQGVLLLCLLWSYPALAAAAPAASMDEVRQSIIQRCRNQMSDYGASIVQVCADGDIEAERALENY